MGPPVGVFGFPVMIQNQEFDPESGDVRCLLVGRESPGPLACHASGARAGSTSQGTGQMARQGVKSEHKRTQKE